VIEWQGEAYYRVREVAAVLGKSVQAVGDDIRTGRLRAVLVANVRHVTGTEMDRFLGGVVETTGPVIRQTMQSKRRAEAAMKHLERRGY
jgi:hypothetical protein